MSEDSIPSLRRKIEVGKNKKKKLQDSYTESVEQYHFYEEKEAQIRDYIRELNNKNKELQKQIDSCKADQLTRNTFFDRQHQETLEKLDRQHQKVLERKAKLYQQVKNGPYEIQQLEEMYKKIISEKQNTLLRKMQDFESINTALTSESTKQDKYLEYVVNETENKPNYAQSSEIISEMIKEEINFSDSGSDDEMEKEIDEIEGTGKNQTERLLICFKKQMNLVQKKNGIQDNIDKVLNIKKMLEAEIVQLEKELKEKNGGEIPALNNSQ